MPSFAKLRPGFRRSRTEDVGPTIALESVQEDKHDPVNIGAVEASISGSNDERQAETIEEDLQRGVEDVEAVTLSWTKASLVAVFVKYVSSITVDLLMHMSDGRQYLAALFRQCIPVLDSLQLASVRHERFRISFAAQRHLHCRRCHVSGGVHSFGQGSGHLGSSRGLSHDDSLCNDRAGHDGCMP